MIANNKKRSDFLKILPVKSTGIELGVFKGEFSRSVLEIVKPDELHLIDSWWLLYGEYYPDWGSYTNYGKLKTKDAYNEMLYNIRKAKEKCKIHVGNDLEILNEFPDDYFDWAYIDSSHEYEHTKNELSLMAEKVKKDGFITGHDWQPDPKHMHHGVYLAINEFCQTTDWKVAYLDNHTQWALKVIK